MPSVPEVPDLEDRRPGFVGPRVPSSPSASAEDPRRLEDSIADVVDSWDPDNESPREAAKRIIALLGASASPAGAPSLNDFDGAEGLKEQAIGKRVAFFREREGLSQSGLARIVGASQSAISQIESGDRTPSYGILVQLADACRVSLARLVGNGPGAVKLAAEGEYIELPGAAPDGREPSEEKFLRHAKEHERKLAVGDRRTP